MKARADELKAEAGAKKDKDAMDGKVVCFFQSAQKFKSRYATLGFSDKATSTTVPCGRPLSLCRS